MDRTMQKSDEARLIANDHKVVASMSREYKRIVSTIVDASEITVRNKQKNSDPLKVSKIVFTT